MKSSIQYGSSLIKFELEFSDRKTLGIKVHPDKSVQVDAPFDSTKEKINEKVRSKARWIIKQQEFFLSFHPLTPPRKFITGETHLYLGKQYRLKIIESPEESVKLYSGYITVNCKDKSDKKEIEQLLKKWYKSKAEVHFNQLFENWKSHLSLSKNNNATLNYKWMNKRWGTCNNEGQITLNIELIKAPKKCIEYVIVHEVCHLSYLNHSKSFYNLLEKHYPEWRNTKYQLEHFMV